MKHISLVTLFLCMVLPRLAGAEVLLDPLTRDADISHTEVSVEISRRDDGLYMYSYSLHVPLDNKDSVGTFIINLRCDQEFPPVVLPTAEGREGYYPIRPLPPAVQDISNVPDIESLRLGSHTPASIFAAYGSAARYGITLSNKAQWLVGAEPGDHSPGLDLISPYGPGLREYVLEPLMEPFGWDYEGYELGPNADVPWIGDFAITGMIAGPECPGVTVPVEMPYFPGTMSIIESEEINKLLTYSAPLKDRHHVDASVEQVSIEINYAENIDPKTFRVQPGWARNLFDPVPGTTQVVVLPLKQAKNLFHLSVEPMSNRVKGNANRRNEYGPPMDRDVFEYRRDVVKPGNGKAK